VSQRLCSLVLWALRHSPNVVVARVRTVLLPTACVYAPYGIHIYIRYADAIAALIPDCAWQHSTEDFDIPNVFIYSLTFRHRPHYE